MTNFEKVIQSISKDDEDIYHVLKTGDVLQIKCDGKWGLYIFIKRHTPDSRYGVFLNHQFKTVSLILSDFKWHKIDLHYDFDLFKDEVNKNNGND